MDADYLKTKFEAGLEYGPYVAAGTEEQRNRWADFQEHVRLTDAQRALVSSFKREMSVIVLSGIWCGDCVQQVPLIEAVGRANPEKIHIRYLERDLHLDLQAQVVINDGQRVPVAIFAAEDFQPCGWFGDRVASRYRRMYEQYKNPVCETGLGGVDADAVARELADWVEPFERIQYMLCLSARLRKKHGD